MVGRNAAPAHALGSYRVVAYSNEVENGVSPESGSAASPGDLSNREPFEG